MCAEGKNWVGIDAQIAASSRDSPCVPSPFPSAVNAAALSRSELFNLSNIDLCYFKLKNKRSFFPLVRHFPSFVNGFHGAGPSPPLAPSLCTILKLENSFVILVDLDMVPRRHFRNLFSLSVALVFRGLALGLSSIEPPVCSALRFKGTTTRPCGGNDAFSRFLLYRMQAGPREKTKHVYPARRLESD